MKKLVILVLIPLLFGCSSDPTTSTRADSKKAQYSKGGGADVLPYFYKLYPKNSNQPIPDLKVDETHIQDGFIKVTGASTKNYYIYDLFSSYATDYVVEQSTECNPACNQSLKVHIFENNGLVKSKSFSDFYSKKDVDTHLEKLKASLPKGKSGKPLQTWFMLPKIGTVISILLVEQYPGTPKGDVGVYQVGTLSWNNRTFDFKAIEPKTLSEISITDVE